MIPSTDDVTVVNYAKITDMMHKLRISLKWQVMNDPNIDIGLRLEVVNSGSTTTTYNRK
jgi:hypothetical protein